MKDLERFDDRTWRKLFTFLLPNEEDMTDEEVETELQHLGIDTRPGLVKLQEGLKKIAAAQEARATLEVARRRRPSIMAKLRAMASKVSSLNIDELRHVIRERFSGTAQAAFFRKLDSAASEDDLRSLLEDMSKLDTLSEESDDAEP